MDKLLIDGQKIMYHPVELAEWFERGTLYSPIYLEVSLTNACNHRCSFCAMDFRKGRDFIGKNVLLTSLFQMKEQGLKSVMFGGEGEPLLHPDFVGIVKQTRLIGLDVALTTNASLLTQNISRGTLPYLSWIKASVDAGTPNTYAKIHGVKPGIFKVVIENMKFAKSLETDASLGLQMLWLPENEKEVETLAEIAKEIGMDYLVVKPYSQHAMSKTRTYEGISYYGWEKVSIPNFELVYRDNAFKRMAQKEVPETCYALPFWAFLDCKGSLWQCSSFLGDERFLLGNIYKEDFAAMWRGALSEFKCEDGCRVNCRMEAVNEYLCKLKSPPKHVNFI